jgi:hypothetical protein
MTNPACHGPGLEQISLGGRICRPKATIVLMFENEGDMVSGFVRKALA